MKFFLSPITAKLSGRKPWQIIAKILLINLLMFSVITSSNAQSIIKGQITGKVIDSVTNQPVDFATISLYKIGATSPFTGLSTGKTGDFTLNDIPEGEYRLTADFLGYRPQVINHVVITKQTPGVSLGIIRLAPVWNSLSEVIIQSKAPVIENKLDKLVYNAAADITAQSGTATDVLTKVPMVSVDIDGNVELQGNANIRFLVNGKPAGIYGSSITDALQTIPASQIQSIEVITSPGAKYDAAGTAGIINIVLKENKTKGQNGSVNLSAGTRLENASVNLNTRNNNWGLSAFFSGNDQLNSHIINTANTLSFNAAKDTLTRYIQKRYTPFSRNGYQSGLNFDWNINPKSDFTATVGYNHIITNMQGITAQDQQTFLSSGMVLNDLNSQRISATNYGETAVNWSLGYKKTFKKEGRELSVLYSSSYSNNTNYDGQVTSYANSNYPASGIKSNNPGTDRETDISVDYTEPLTKGFEIETGLKAVLENINNTVVTDTLLNTGNYITDPGQTYQFSFTRNIYAGYLSTSFALFNDFFNGKAGMRFEHTDNRTDLAGISIPADNIWAPDFLVQHKLNESESLRFAYTFRIERPDYEDLNPFLDIIDPHNISTGNPLTKNETGHKFELGYSKSFANGSSLYIGGFYNYNDNDIQYFTTYYSAYQASGSNYYDVSVAKATNIGSQTTLGVNISGSAVIARKFTLRTDIFLLSKNNLEPGLPSVGGFSYKINANATYQLTDNLVAEAFGVINSKRTDFQNVRPGSYFYTFAVKKQLFNKKASFGFTSTNPFNPYINQYSSAYGTGFTQTNMRQKTLRSFGITLSYKFGNLKAKEADSDDHVVAE